MSDNNNGEMSFLEHLEDLRWHIIKSAASVLILAVVAFLFKGFVFDTIILGPSSPKFITNQLLCQLAVYLDMPVLCINSQPLNMQNINMSGQFATHIWISFMAGIILSIPVIFREFWLFIKPALYENELKYSRSAIFYTSALFIVGILFSYYIICPLSIDFLGNYKVSETVDNIINLDSYISIISSVILSTGVVFELPVFIYFLTKVGLVSSSFLSKYRKHAVMLIMIVAAIITPPDILSMFLVLIPLYLLFEVSILISKRIERKNLKAQQQQD